MVGGEEDAAAAERRAGGGGEGRGLGLDVGIVGCVLGEDPVEDAEEVVVFGEAGGRGWDGGGGADC